MNDEISARAKAVFQDAAELPSEERERFITERCDDDAELLAHVRRLLRAHEHAGEFLGSPTSPSSPARTEREVDTAEPKEGAGTRVGPYKLLELIGEGGFGRVYMAEQEEPIRRRVALKIIKLGMDTKSVIARFEAERQALALMDHPNIARVLDAGATPSGRPFFVMELVRGLPITEYCDANRATTRERLELFIDVCRALHHAHEKGVVHRDVKPSNVLVTLHDGEPVVKVIDFGIAKALNQPLTEKTLFTAWGEFVGTPAYMSPEQAALGGLEINRRCDVYALGVLLYELLTGTTPLEEESLRTRAFLEIMRIIREDDPPTPSSRMTMRNERLLEVAKRRGSEPRKLARLLRGDLDWIVMKALEKDRRRRYESAADVADDISRYFRHQPVRARRRSVAYSLSRLARRRRGTIGAAALIVAAAVLGGFLSRLGKAEAAAAPSARLVSDVMEDSGRQGPLYDDRYELRYTEGRGGYEVRHAGNGRVRRFIPVAREYRAPVWGTNELSPDHSQVAIQRRIPSGPDSGRIEVRIFSAGGSPEGRRLRMWNDAWQVRPFGWSADQRRLWVMSYGEGSHIAAVDLATGEEQILKRFNWHNTTQTPSLSPDGRYLAYHDAEGRGMPADIFILAADGASEHRIVHPSDDSNPIFTPDGAGIVFQSYREGRDLWYQRVEDGRPVGDPRPVWRDTGPYGMTLQFSRSGSLYYYFSVNGWTLYSAAVDIAAGRVGDPVAITARAADNNDAPTYSDDGRLLAHARQDGRRVVIRDLERGTERELPTGARLTMPGLDFCPGGATLLLSGYEGARGQVVYRLDITRGGTELLDVEPQIYTPTVCLGDDEIAYVRDTSRVVRRTISSGAEVELWRSRAPRLSIYRSADRNRIAVLTHPLTGRVQREWAPELVVVPTAGGAPLSVPGPWFGIGAVMWLPQGSGLLVTFLVGDEGADQSAPQVALVHVPFEGSRREIGRMRLPAYRDAIFGSYHWTLHPSGTRVSFARHTGQIGQVWAIDNLLAFVRSGESAPARVRR